VGSSYSGMIATASISTSAPGRACPALALLAERAAERRDRFPDETAADELDKLVERRRAELQGEAMDLAKRLFRKRPRKVVRPLETSGLPA
jgi:hypothetical protein